MSSRPPGGNFWFDSDNFSKWCVEGAVSNLIGQLLSINDAAKFKQLAICNGEQLITALNERSIPKKKNTQQDKLMLWKSVCGYYVHVLTVEDHCF